MKLYRVEAIVLRTFDLGDGSKLLVLYSRQRGKIKTVAHGSAKPASKKRGAVQPFTRASFLLRRGGELDTVSQCEGLDMFPFLWSDIQKLACASLVTELIDAAGLEGEPCSELYDLAVEVLSHMAEVDPWVCSLAFAVKCLALTGYRPVLSECAGCGSRQLINPRFSPGAGGAVCSSCTPAAGSFNCSGAALKVLEVLLGWPVSRLRRLRLDSRLKTEVLEIISSYTAHHLGRDLKSASFVQRLPGV